MSLNNLFYLCCVADRSEVTDLMRLHLRLATIKHEIEILENPDMRSIFEEIKFPFLREGSCTEYMVAQTVSIPQHLFNLEATMNLVGRNKPAKLCANIQV